MAKNLIVSNRLPVQINNKGGKLDFSRSIGGLATGLSTVHNDNNSLWAGWIGLEMENLDPYEIGDISSRLSNDFRCVPVFLTEKEIELYYNCFSNKTIWPLFHYFPTLASYEIEWWESYKEVNKKFFNSIQPLIKEGDTVWIHDYQLMLLPQMVREMGIDVKIGYFLHIPFPSYEMFRLLPWRNEILDGLLGSDLIGFHTYDYARHFLSSARRLKRLDATLGTLKIDGRSVNVDAFPMGIDYDKYASALSKTEVKKEMKVFKEKINDTKLILSVDRLDYTKGIPGRLHAIDLFLQRYPEWKEKVTLILIVAPSRTHVDSYLDLKKEIDELVSVINSKHGSIGWVPIWYFYRSFDFNKLTALYGLTDVLLIAPIRDGMNLVVKEYIAARSDKKGVVIISETTGASSELGEAISVNANNIDEIADSIQEALSLPVEEQIAHNTIMHARLKRYNVTHWAEDFMSKLDKVVEERKKINTTMLSEKLQNKMFAEFKKNKKKIIFLDYDGTLVSFKEKPEMAFPDNELLQLITKLTELPNTEVAIVSGRGRDVLEKWVGHLNVHLAAGHGVWIKRMGTEWDCLVPGGNEWKDVIRPVLDVHMSRTPGSSIEEKKFSLAWHYRRCDFELAELRVSELKEALLGLTDNLNIGILEGNKVLEIKDTSINKGRAVSTILQDRTDAFILAAGDDWTDEDMFMACPETAWTVKVGFDSSNAKYKIENCDKVRELLENLIRTCN